MKLSKKLNSLDARQFFTGLFSRLSPAAQRCDVGLFVLNMSGACVDNFRNGKESTTRDRAAWLLAKLNECRGYSNALNARCTLALLFPADYTLIQSAFNA